MKFKDGKNDYCIDLTIIIVIPICILIIVLGLREYNFSNEIRIKEYQKILNNEFGRDFTNYNEYLVYKLNK